MSTKLTLVVRDKKEYDVFQDRFIKAGYQRILPGVGQIIVSNKTYLVQKISRNSDGVNWNITIDFDGPETELLTELIMRFA